MTTTGAAGWHRDPSGRHEHRYFDGQRWTEHVSTGGRVGVDPVPSPPVRTPGPSIAGMPNVMAPGGATRRLDGGSIAAAVGAGVVMLAAFMPWARVWVISASGIDGGDGWITLVLAGVGLLLSLMTIAGTAQPKAHIGTILLGLGVGAVGLVDLSNVMDEPMAEVGMGLWLTIAGAAAMVVGAAVSLANDRNR